MELSSFIAFNLLIIAAGFAIFQFIKVVSTLVRNHWRILDEVHESARDLHEAGAIDTQTMRRFDALRTIPRRRR